MAQRIVRNPRSLLLLAPILLAVAVAAPITFPQTGVAQSLASTPSANTVSPSVTYDVSSVKPHDPSDQNMNWSENEDGFYADDVDLKNVIADAWHMRPDQLTGEPSWAEDLHWDIAGKSTELTREQLKMLLPAQRHQMMQQLLAERFHLRAHIETRTGPIFTLVPAKRGVKLKPIAMTADQRATGKVPDSSLRLMGGDAAVMEAKNIPLASLLENLALNLHEKVIDKTGLPADAVYDFTLRWEPDYGTGKTPESNALPMPAALEDQLGLRLQASKGPVQVLVIDHVEKPTAD